MSNRMQGKTALISGSARGIGAAIAEQFAAEGAAVVVTDVRDDLGQAVAQRITDGGGRAIFQHLDVRRREEWDQARDRAETELGPADVLVSNAFIVSQPAILDVSAQEWTASLEVNLTGAFHGLQALLPGMRDRGQGSIVVVSATQGNEVAVPSQAAYQPAKAGLSALVRHVAITYGHDGIRANALHPGAIDTEMLEEEGIRPFADQLAQTWPIPRLGRPSDLAQAAVFLASDESGFTTGASLVIDGGSSVGISLPPAENS